MHLIIWRLLLTKGSDDSNNCQSALISIVTAGTTNGLGQVLTHVVVVVVVEVGGGGDTPPKLARRLAYCCKYRSSIFLTERQ